MDFLFLPPIYLLVSAASGVVVGALFDRLSRTSIIVSSGLLFGVFMTSQLIFRILLNEMPERLVGQLIYFLLFLLIVYITRTIKERFIGE